MLTPCRQCHRHVRSEDQACPFCGARRASLLRGVRNVAAAAAILSIGACGNDTAQRTADIYGGPPAPEEGPQTPEDPAGPQDPSDPLEQTPAEPFVEPIAPAPAYGGAPMPESPPADPDPGAPEADPETSVMRQRQPAVYGGPPVRRAQPQRERDILDDDE